MGAGQLAQIEQVGDSGEAGNLSTHGRRRTPALSSKGSAILPERMDDHEGTRFFLASGISRRGPDATGKGASSLPFSISTGSHSGGGSEYFPPATKRFPMGGTHSVF